MCFDLFSMCQVAEAEKETLKSSLELMEIRLSSMKEILKTQESELSKVDTVQLYCNTVGCGLGVCVWGGGCLFLGGVFLLLCVGVGGGAVFFLFLHFQSRSGFSLPGYGSTSCRNRATRSSQRHRCLWSSWKLEIGQMELDSSTNNYARKKEKRKIN